MTFKYIIGLPIGRTPVGTRYPKGTPLPLHCTVMHWFRHDPTLARWDLSEVVDDVVTNVGVPCIELVSEGPDFFGPDNNIPVYTLRRNESLNLLHTGLLICLSQRLCEFTEFRWVGAGYRPHVTTVGSKAFVSGTRFQAHTVVVVECDEEGNRLVLSEHRFSKQAF